MLINRILQPCYNCSLVPRSCSFFGQFFRIFCIDDHMICEQKAVLFFFSNLYTVYFLLLPGQDFRFKAVVREGAFCPHQILVEKL